MWRALKKTYCLFFFVFEALKKKIERERTKVREPGCSKHRAFFQHFTAFDSGISELSHGGTQKRQIEKQHHGGNEKVMRHTTGFKEEEISSPICEL